MAIADMLEAVKNKLDGAGVEYIKKCSRGVEGLKVENVYIYFDERFGKIVVDKPLGANTYTENEIDKLIDHLCNGFFWY
jgi:primase-polymerase (primpol)-like protein